ncbi:MAG: calcium-binding EGF-like domain-containing protein [Myxococcota bacterium]
MSLPSRFWIACCLAGLLSGCLKEVPPTAVYTPDVLAPQGHESSLDAAVAADDDGAVADTVDVAADAAAAGSGPVDVGGAPDGATAGDDAEVLDASIPQGDALFVGDSHGASDVADRGDTAGTVSSDATDTSHAPEGDTLGPADVASGADDVASEVVVVAVDECADQLDDCDEHAACEDTALGWTCTCLSGFTGDGQSCADVDECLLGLDDCAPDALCTNADGSWSCECLAGYAGPGTSCEDVNECATGADNCHAAADCTNVPGSWDCACQEGFEGDGVTCTSTAPVDPPAIFLTVSRIPDYLNGSLPYFDASLGSNEAFYVRTSLERTCLDVAPLEGSGPVDWSTLSLSCDRPFIAEGLTAKAAGESYAMDGALEDDGWRSVCIAFTEPLVDAVVTCSASVEGPSGHVGAAAMDFLTTPLPANLDPMAAPQTWVLSFERDVWSHTAPIGFLGLTNTFIADGNGIPDFDEAMAAIGLMDLNNPAVAAWSRAQLKQAIKRHFVACYDPRDDAGIPIGFVLDDAAGAPSLSEFSSGPRSSENFSVLSIGGWDPKGDAVWGRCPYDANNQRNEDVSQSPELGVMTGQVAGAILTSNLNVGYPAELVPQVGGTAFGADFADGIVLGADFDIGSPDLPARVEAVLYAIELVAAFTALVGCHEVGHSLGLLPNGPPPEGLFGGVLGPTWVGEQTTPMHCEIGHNIMGAAISIYDAYVQLTEPRMFTPLVEAYLRSEIVVGDPHTNARIIFFWHFPNSVPNGVTFEACLDSATTQFCETGGEGGVMTFYDLPANSFASVELKGGPFARTLYNYFFYAVPDADTVYDYWANVIEVDDLIAVRAAAGVSEEAATGIVWSSVLTYDGEQVSPGITSTRVTLNGSSEGAYCVTSLSPATVIDASLPLPAGTSCEHYVFFNVPEGEHTLAVYTEDGGALSPRSCIPLAAWAQYGGYIATVEVVEDVVTRPILGCQ